VEYAYLYLLKNMRKLTKLVYAIDSVNFTSFLRLYVYCRCHCFTAPFAVIRPVWRWLTAGQLTWTNSSSLVQKELA